MNNSWDAEWDGAWAKAESDLLKVEADLMILGDAAMPNEIMNATNARKWLNLRQEKWNSAYGVARCIFRILVPTDCEHFVKMSPIETKSWIKSHKNPAATLLSDVANRF